MANKWRNAILQDFAELKSKGLTHKSEILSEVEATRECAVAASSECQWWGELVLPDDCHLDTLPSCARKAITDPDPAGRLIKESPNRIMTRLRLSSTYAAGVEISTSLPRGYGGSLGTEG